MRRLKRTLWFLSFTFLVVLSAGLAVYIPIYQESADDAVNIEKRLVVNDQNPTIIWSGDAKPVRLYSVAAIRRKVIDLTDPKYPKYVRLALVAAEDRRFFDHQGVDPIGLARAVYKRGGAGGGSTIPMQLAKNLVNGDEHSFRRKFKDIATAQQIESLKTKDEILNLYANSSYFGERAFGIERAAEVYFGKTADKLTVGEAAMLARCVRLPSRVNPVKSLEKMLPLRDYVLGVMLEENWITQEQYDSGIREVPKVKGANSQGEAKIAPGAGYFVQHVLSKLDDDIGTEYRAGGYQIYTTLNYALQKRAVDAVNDVLRENRGHSVNDGAIVLMDGTGRILCEVGGPDYKKRQYNVVTQGRRQPGSAFKSILYAIALKNEVITPDSYLDNSPIHEKLGNGRYWNPQNASRKENAPGYGLTTAFALSVNRPAIHTIMKTGAKNVVAGAHDIFGIKSPLLAVDSLALGTSEVKPLELLEAYSVFMLGGDRAEPRAILNVVGPTGETVRTYDPVIRRGVLGKNVAREMDEILKSPVAFGTATYAQAVPNARGKTGTTNAAKDAWFCGYSDGLVGVGWVGNSTIRNGKHHALPMSSSVFGGTVTVKIWTAVMKAAHALNLSPGTKANVGTSVEASVAPDEPEKPKRREAPAKPTEPDPDEPVLEPTVDPASDPNSDDPPQNDGTKPPSVPDATAPPLPDKNPVDPPTPATDPVERPRRTRRDPAPKRDEETEPVEICVDTGLRANPYCPETVTRSFPKGRAPKKTCTLHHG